MSLLHCLDKPAGGQLSLSCSCALFYLSLPLLSSSFLSLFLLSSALLISLLLSSPLLPSPHLSSPLLSSHLISSHLLSAPLICLCIYFGHALIILYTSHKRQSRESQTKRQLPKDMHIAGRGERRMGGDETQTEEVVDGRRTSCLLPPSWCVLYVFFL